MAATGTRGRGTGALGVAGGVGEAGLKAGPLMVGPTLSTAAERLTGLILPVALPRGPVFSPMGLSTVRLSMALRSTRGLSRATLSLVLPIARFLSTGLSTLAGLAMVPLFPAVPAGAVLAEVLPITLALSTTGLVVLMMVPLLALEAVRPAYPGLVSRVLPIAAFLSTWLSTVGLLATAPLLMALAVRSVGPCLLTMGAGRSTGSPLPETNPYVARKFSHGSYHAPSTPRSLTLAGSVLAASEEDPLMAAFLAIGGNMTDLGEGPNKVLVGDQGGEERRGEEKRRGERRAVAGSLLMVRADILRYKGSKIGLGKDVWLCTTKKRGTVSLDT